MDTNTSGLPSIRIPEMYNGWNTQHWNFLFGARYLSASKWSINWNEMRYSKYTNKICFIAW